MAEAAVPVKADLPPPPPVAADGATLAPSLPAAPDPASAPSPPLSPVAVVKKKSAYRPQKTAATVAEHIIEAVAATRERQVPATLATMRKTISAAGYEVERSGARPTHSAMRAPPPSQSPSVFGGGPGSLEISKEQEAKGEARKKPKGRKASPTRAAAAKKAAVNAKGPKALKKSAAKSRKASKRPVASRPVGRKRRAGKRR